MNRLHTPQIVERPYSLVTGKNRLWLQGTSFMGAASVKAKSPMGNLSTKQFSAVKPFTAVWLFAALLLSLQSCDDQIVPLEESKVQFTLSPGTTSQGRVKNIELPENARLRITIESAAGTPIFSDHEIQVMKDGSGYTTDPLELMPGAYAITDFMIVQDGEVLNAAPKSESPFSGFVRHSLPHNFLVAKNSAANVSMEVIDARNEKPEAFGYRSFRKANTLSFVVNKANGGQKFTREATGELRQGKQLIETFSAKPGMNKIAFEGDPDAMYTLSIYAGEEAKVTTFNFRELKKQLGARPLKITLEPALVVKLESSVDEGNEYDEYFEFVLEGTGAVNINWGDGGENSRTLPVNDSHEYTTGNYTAVITGDLDQITNVYGFSYGTYMYAITGLTNLTALKTYSPSWGAVPIKVDLSNCKNLERIQVYKYGAPYESSDLRTDFKLPQEHFIKDFTFDAPSFDINRVNISPGELEVFVDNIYNNTVRRDIRDGTFYVYPAEVPWPETQKKLDILQQEYNWDVEVVRDPYDYSSEVARLKQDAGSGREDWLRQKFPKSKHLLRRGRMVVEN